MKQINEATRFIHGAFILTVTTAIVKIIGFLFTIPLANMLGADGMGYFYSSYDIYNMLTVLATAGLPVAVSRMISETTQKNQPANINRIYKIALISFSLVGLVISLLMFFGADQWAAFIKNPGASLAIRALSITSFFAFTMSALRGYFQGHSDMIPTAVSQVIEALSKLVIGCSLAYYIMKTSGNYMTGAASAILGVSIGAVLATIILFFYKRKYNKRYYHDITDKVTRTDKDILLELVKISIPIALGASVMSIVNFFDMTLIMRQLQDTLGYTGERANWLYGTYGNAKKIFNLPAAFIIPFSVSILPALTSAITRDDKDQIRNNLVSVFKYPMMISFPAGFGLITLAYPILSIIYFSRPDEVTAGTPLLAVLGLAVILNSLVVITNAVLQSYKKVNFSMFAMFIGAGCKLLLNWGLIRIESVNIMGAPIATCACYAVIALLNILYLRKLIPPKSKVIKNLALITLASGIMGGSAYVMYNIAERFINAKIAGIVTIMIAALIYLALIIIFKVVTKAELVSMLSRKRS
jgi:Membrane protein involved in the export of O-antigen and teichoic acid